MIKYACVPVLTLVLLAGCNKAVPAVPQAPAGNAPHPGESWELVTLERSEPLNFGMRFMKAGAYEMCKGLAEARHRTAAPFPAIPDDYEDERVTRITDGKSTVVIRESMGGDDEKIDIEGDCHVTLKTAKTKVVTVLHGDKRTTIIDGQVTDTEDIPPWPAFAPRGKSTADYTIERMVNGVRIRCLPESHWVLNTNDRLDGREMCVYYLDNVMVDESGDPVIVRSHAYVNLVADELKHMVNMEPQSMRRIGASEKNPYLVANWLK